jgi:hypothetical protein
VEGTRTFFAVSVVLLAVGLWSLKDGWFPSEKVLKKHPIWDAQGQLDHFYTFNRSLAFLSLIGSGVCAYIHRVVR